MILANEIAILLAKRRAEELPDLRSYSKGLVSTDPLVLYCACLKALKEKFNDFYYSYSESPSMFAFFNFLTTEIDSLHAENLWPNHVPDRPGGFDIMLQVGRNPSQ
ncbi:MAG: hypothetical protein U9R58_05985 [Chloroflexota bacterium]|nr:hypothetical protein [Chloroflexota bacterium]